MRLGRTLVTFGDYWLLEGSDRASAEARSAFVSWLEAETQGTGPPRRGEVNARMTE
jgi:hypothetical protein